MCRMQFGHAKTWRWGVLFYARKEAKVPDFIPKASLKVVSKLRNLSTCMYTDTI